MSVSFPPSQIQQAQLQVQQRLLTLANQQLTDMEQGQINPVLTQNMANIATAAGLNGSKSYLA